MLENHDYFNLLELKEQYNKNVLNFELNTNNMLYSELLCKNHYNELDKENMEFLSPNTNTFNCAKEHYGKYICRLFKFSFDNDNEFNVEIIKILKKSIKYYPNSASPIYPELYIQIKSFCSEQIITSNEYLNIKQLKEQIISIKKYLKDNYLNNKSKLATDLYKYYYSNIDKFIEFDDNNNNIKSYKNFYITICVKNQILERNFKLDYLQYYFEYDMLLLPDFEIIYDETNGIIFENNTYELKISTYPQKYINSYQPQYNVCLTEKNNPTNIKKIGWNSFDADRKLDVYYSNIINYIIGTIDEGLESNFNLISSS